MPRKSALLDDAGFSEGSVFLAFFFFPPSPRKRTGETGVINRYGVQSRSDWDKGNGEAQTQIQTQTRWDVGWVSRGFDIE
jgi:hypothetical protein